MVKKLVIKEKFCSFSVFIYTKIINFKKNFKIKYKQIVIIIFVICLSGCFDKDKTKDFSEINECFDNGNSWDYQSNTCKKQTKEERKEKRKKRSKHKTKKNNKTSSPTNTSSGFTGSASSHSMSNTKPMATTITLKRKSPPNSFLKLTVEEAYKKAQIENIDFRVIINNGKPVTVKKGFILGRYNASVENNKIIKVTVEGLD